MADTDFAESKFAGNVFTLPEITIFGDAPPQSSFTVLPTPKFQKTLVTTPVATGTTTPTGVDVMNDRIKADPDTNVRVRAVEVDPDSSDPLKIASDVVNAINDMNAARAAAGKGPVKFDAAELATNLESFNPSTGGLAVPVSTDTDGKGIFIVLASKGKDDDIDRQTVTPLSDAFRAKAQQNDADGVLTPLHEVGHAIRGGDEKHGDAAYLARVADMMPDIAGAKDFLKVEADRRSVQTDNGHFQAGDVLLRMRHDLETDPAGFQARLAALPKGSDGKTLVSAAEDLAIDRYVKPSDADLPDFNNVNRALDFARNRVIRFDQEQAGNAESDMILKSAIPSNLNRDGAVAILRMQQSIEENGADGKNNGLTAILPELFDKNPKAFADAQAYMNDTYGMTVPNPGPMTGPPEPLSPAAMVNERLRDDPSTNTRVRIVEFDTNDPGRIMDSFNAAVGEITDARSDARKNELNFDVAKVLTAVSSFDPSEGSMTVKLGNDESGKPIAITIVNPRHALSDQLDRDTIVPVTDAFKAQVQAADHDNLYNTLRATGTDVNGTTASRAHNEKVGSGMMLLAVANNEPNVAANLGAEADMASLSTDTAKFLAGDVLLRMKHDVETNPAGLRAQIDALPKGDDGQPLIDNIKRLELKNYVLPSDTELPNLGQTRDAIDFAQRKMAHFDQVAQGLPAGPDPKIPGNLTRDGAVALLRIQASVEQNGVNGADNGLSAAMPELWKKNPAAFAAAQKYMDDKYGITVQNPLQQQPTVSFAAQQPVVRPASAAP